MIPQRKEDTADSVNGGAEDLIRICEAAGVRRFVQSSVPVHELESQVPKLAGKRAIERARVISLPARFARVGQIATRPFSPAAGNVLALVRFVATWQPRWENYAVVEELGLPRQWTVKEYLEETARP